MSRRIEAASARDAFAITPSDSTVIAFEALYVDSIGDVVVKTYGGSTVTFSAVPSGVVLPIRGTQVRAATTATVIGLIY